MLIRKFLLSTALCAFAGGAQAATNWATDVPLSACDGVPCVMAQVGSAPPALAVIDTGDVATVVDTSQAAAIGFDSKPDATGHMRAAHPNVQIGDVTLENAVAIALPISDFMAKGQMPHASATIAYSAFKDRIVQLDFVHHRLRISAPQPASAPCSASCGALHLITFGKKGPPIVVADGFSVNGKPITVQIDSVFTGGLLIYDASIGKLGLHDASTAATQTEKIAFTDGGVTMRRSTAKDVGFGGESLAQDAALYFPTDGVHQPDALFDGTVGLMLLQGNLVTLDFHAMTMTIAKG